MIPVHFFGENGLTSTSANHVANLAKEAIVSLRAEIENIRFFSEETKASGYAYVTQIESNKSDFQAIEEKIKKIQDLTKLIAWLREALKAKENIKVISFEDWCKQNSITIPEYPQLKDTITEQDVIALWDIEKYNALFSHQTNAAVLGEFIHPNGELSIARKTFFRKLQNPTTVNNSGRDLTVITSNSEYSKEEVDDMFFKLQTLQREEQSKYNKLRHEIDSLIENDRIEKYKLYSEQLSVYNSIVHQANSQYLAFAAEEQKRVKNLKIVIPPSLQEIYKEVQNLGK